MGSGQFRHIKKAVYAESIDCFFGMADSNQSGLSEHLAGTVTISETEEGIHLTTSCWLTPGGACKEYKTGRITQVHYRIHCILAAFFCMLVTGVLAYL